MSAPYKIQLYEMLNKRIRDQQYGYYSQRQTDKLIDECKEWCKTNVGPDQWNYYGQHKRIPDEFRFKHEVDLLAFKLRCIL